MVTAASWMYLHTQHTTTTTSLHIKCDNPSDDTHYNSRWNPFGCLILWWCAEYNTTSSSQLNVECLYNHETTTSSLSNKTTTAHIIKQQQVDFVHNKSGI